MSVETKRKFEAFLKANWPLPPVKETVDPSTINRLVWYCNASGRFIPELQKYNKNPNLKTDDEEKEDKTISTMYYNEGYTAYRVYPNGLAFADVNIIAMLFDYYVNSFYSPKPDVKDMKLIMDNLPVSDPFETIRNKGLHYAGRDSAARVLPLGTTRIYEICNLLSCGTIISKNIIPKEYLPYLVDLFEIGDVVDTEGYRGLGLYMLISNGSEPAAKKFVKVPLGEYYPIWPLQMLKQHGYRKMLKTLMWHEGEPDFDELKFDNGISLYKWSDKPFKMGSFESPEPEEGDEENENENELDLRNTENGYYVIEYPFTNHAQLNTIVKMTEKGAPLETAKFRAKISDYDYLLFEKGRVYVTDLKCEEKLSLA